MLHITELKKPGKLRGVSRIDEVKESLGLTSALDEFAARFFGQGSTTHGLIEYPGALNQEQAKNMVNAFEQGHRGLKRSHRPGVLFGGAKFVKTGVDPNEAQMLQSREFQITEIARVFRIPPHMLGITTPGSMSYASVEQNSINFVTYTLNPYLAKLEAAYSSILPAGVFLRFNTNALLRGDTTTRFAAYNSALQSGWLSINDIHRLEDLRPVEGGDVYRVPLANVDLAAANLVETDRRIMMAVRLVTAGFDPSEVLSALDLPAIEHTGLPSVQLQGAAQVSPDDPSAAYPVN
jgi:HK97 family phage portal protein